MGNSNFQSMNPFAMLGIDTGGIDPQQLTGFTQQLGPDFFSGLLGQYGHSSGNPFGTAMIKQMQQPGALAGLIGNPGLANLRGDTGNRMVQIMQMLQQKPKKPQATIA